MIVLPDDGREGRTDGRPRQFSCGVDGNDNEHANRWPFSRKTITVIITRRSAAMTATAATARHSYVRHKYVPRLHGKQDTPELHGYPKANVVKMPNEALRGVA